AETAAGAWRAAPPAPVRGNPTGAGDSAVAGLLAGLVEGADWPDRLVRAAALSAATVHASAAGEYDEAVYRDLAVRITATAPHGAA
ncbi:PfkB family carbohydrate kinase, partial [Streptomyces diastaticus]